MNILSDLTALVNNLGISVETGVFSDVAPDEYVVITPLDDTFEIFCDNLPSFELQDARLSIFCKGNYLALKDRIVRALLADEFTISARRYIGHEDDTGYHHYAVDVSKIFAI